MNFFVKKVEKGIDISCKTAIILYELHTSLIKSGGGNGPMKPGNLSERMMVPNPAATKDEDSILRTSSPSVCGFCFFHVIANQSADWCGNLPDIPGWLQALWDSHASVRAGSE